MSAPALSASQFVEALALQLMVENQQVFDASPNQYQITTEYGSGKQPPTINQTTIQLSSTNDNFLTVTPMTLDCTNGFTWEAWLNLATPSGTVTLLDLESSSASASIILQLTSGNVLELTVNGGTAVSSASLSSYMSSTTEWVHIALSAGAPDDGAATALLFVNGSAVDFSGSHASATISGLPTAATTYDTLSHIGAGDNTAYLNGTIGTMRLYTAGSSTTTTIQPLIWQDLVTDFQTIAQGLTTSPSPAPFQVLQISSNTTLPSTTSHAAEADFSQGFTLMGWIESTAAIDSGDSKTWLTGDLTASTWQPTLNLVGTNSVSATAGIPGSSNPSITASSVWQENEWVHIALSVSNTGEATLYKNGLLQTGLGEALTLPQPGSASYLFYLEDNSASSGVTGHTSSVEIYSIGLTQSQITASMLAGWATVQSLPPLSQLQLGVTDGTVTDSSQNSFPIVANEGVDITAEGLMTFTGAADSFLTLPALSLDLSNGLTIEGWVQASTPAAEQTATLLYLGNSATDNLTISLTSSGYVEVSLNGEAAQSGTATTATGSTHVVATGTWQYFGVKISGASATVTLDGAGATAANFTGSGTLATTTVTYEDCYIGQNASGEDGLVGNLCSFRIYSGALSSNTSWVTQIKTNMPTDAENAGMLPSLQLQTALGSDGQIVDLSPNACTNAYVTNNGAIILKNADGTDAPLFSTSKISSITDFILQAWVQLDAALSSSQNIISVSNLSVASPTSTDYYPITLSSSYSSTYPAATGWHHIALVQSSGAQTLYINGQLDHSYAAATPSAENRGVDFLVTLDNYKHASYTGIRVYNAVPTDPQPLIQSTMLADAEAAGITPFLLLHAEYESSTPYIKDVSPYGATITPTPALDSGGPAISINDNAIDFTGAFAATSFYPASPANSDSGYTLETWVNFATLTASTNTVLLSFVPASGQSIILGSVVDADSNRSLVCQTYNGTTYTLAETVQSIAGKEEWVHVACTLDSAYNILGLQIMGLAQTVVTSTSSSGTFASPSTSTPYKIYIGSLDGSSDKLDGQLCGVRLYGRILSDTEIQADLVADSAPTTFSQSMLINIENSYPVDFSLLNRFQNQSTLFTRLQSQSLNFTIQNTSRGTLTIPFAPTASNKTQDWYNQNSGFYLLFRPGTLWETDLQLYDATGNSITANSPINAHDSTLKLNGTWSLVYDQWRTDHMQGFFLVNNSGQNFNLPPFTPMEFRIEGIQVDGRGGSRGTNVELKYMNLTSSDADIQTVSGNRMHYLSIMDESPADLPASAPIQIGILGSNTISNAADAGAQSIVVRYYNNSGISLSITPSTSKLSIQIPQSSTAMPWGLAASPSDFTAELKASTGSTFTGGSFTVTDPGNGYYVATLEAPAGITSLPIAGYMDIQLGITTTAPNGAAQIVASYSGFGDNNLEDTQIVEVIKSPLIINRPTYPAVGQLPSLPLQNTTLGQITPPTNAPLVIGSWVTGATQTLPPTTVTGYGGNYTKTTTLTSYLPGSGLVVSDGPLIVGKPAQKSYSYQPDYKHASTPPSYSPPEQGLSIVTGDLKVHDGNVYINGVGKLSLGKDPTSLNSNTTTYLRGSVVINTYGHAVDNMYSYSAPLSLNLGGKFGTDGLPPIIPITPFSPKGGISAWAGGVKIQLTEVTLPNGTSVTISSVDTYLDNAHYNAILTSFNPETAGSAGSMVLITTDYPANGKGTGVWAIAGNQAPGGKPVHNATILLVHKSLCWFEHAQTATLDM